MNHALLLTPGAGASADSPALKAVEDAVSKHFFVERMDFPYRLAGRKAPDRAPVLVEAVKEGVAQLSEKSGVDPDRIFVGGRSMGGRMCSMAVAEGMPTAGLVLMSYPLHPPGRPDKLRVDHFGQIAVPALFVSGTRDAFGRPEEFAEHLPSIAGPVDTQWVEGGDHGMAKHNAVVAGMVREWLLSRIA